MKDLVFAGLILGFAVYTLVAFFLNLEPSYGIYGVLISMGAEVGYNEWLKRKSNGNKA